MPGQAEIDNDVLEEGCYYLTRLGLSYAKLAAHFGITSTRVEELASSYSEKLETGKVVTGEFDQTFWREVKKEAEGDVKVTFVSERGFHHAWKSELEKLDGATLMSIFESSKDFLSADQNRKFLDFPPPKGYDPLALDREVRKAVGIVSELLERKWKEQKTEEERQPRSNTHA